MTTVRMLEIVAADVDSRVRRYSVDARFGVVFLKAHIGWRWFIPWIRTAIRVAYMKKLKSHLPICMPLEVKFRW